MSALLSGCAPHRISENIKTLKAKGVPERSAISQAHAYAKQAKKAQDVGMGSLPQMKDESVS